MLLSWLSAALAGCGARDPVLIGVSTSVPSVHAARMAIEDELAAAPLPGLDTVMIPESSNLASPAIRAAQRLVDRDGLVAVIGHANSSASLAVAPIYNAHHVVQIAPAASAAVFSEAGAYSFRLVQSDDRQAAFLADRLRQKFPHGVRVAVVYVNDEYGRGLRSALAESLPDDRLQMVLESPLVEGEVEDADLAYLVASLGTTRPDVVVWLARGGVLARSIEPLREVLPKVAILGADAVAAANLADVPPDLREGVWFVEHVDLDGSPALRTFKRRYRERFGADPSGPQALTYDAVRLVVSGVRAGGRTGPRLRSYLVSLGRTSPPYVGLTGSIAFDRDGNVERAYVLEQLGYGGGR